MRTPSIVKQKRICQNCDKEFYAYPSDILKGRGKYCSQSCSIIGLNNYRKSVRHSRKCQISGCLKKHYAKGYCRNHYSKYVSNHHRRHDIKAVIRPKKANKGANHYWWKGGKSQYNDCYLMRKARKIIMSKAKGLCEVCGRKGDHIHHLDCGRHNHSVCNLMLVCIRCHRMIHRGVRRLKEIEKEYDIIDTHDFMKTLTLKKVLTKGA